MPRSRSTASKASRPRRASGATATRRAGGPAAVRLVEATGSSRRGWEGAVADAVHRARDDAPRPVAVEVARLWADLDARSGLKRYHAAVKVAYPVPLARPAASRRRARPR